MSNIYKNIKDNYEEGNTFTTLKELKGSELFVYCMIGGNNGSISQNVIAELTKSSDRTYISKIIKKLEKKEYIKCISPGSKTGNRPAKYKLLKENTEKYEYFRLNINLFNCDNKCSISALGRYLEMRISNNTIWGNSIYTLNNENLSELDKELINAGLIKIVSDSASNKKYVIFTKEKTYELEDGVVLYKEEIKEPWDNFTKKELWLENQELKKKIEELQSLPKNTINLDDFDF